MLFVMHFGLAVCFRCPGVVVTSESFLEKKSEHNLE